MWSSEGPYNEPMKFRPLSAKFYLFPLFLTLACTFSSQPESQIGVERMRALVQTHADLEAKLDVEGVLGTLVDQPRYEFHPARLKIEGRENVREFYQEHFAKFFPLITSHKVVSESWNPDSAYLEYDLFLKSRPQKPYRIMVVLRAKDSRLLGEEFFMEDELLKLMAGDSFSKFVVIP